MDSGRGIALLFCVTMTHTQEYIQRLDQYERIPTHHADELYNRHAVSPSHSLAVVVQSCGGRSTEEQLFHALRHMDGDRHSHRVPVIVLAKDAAEANVLKSRFGVRSKAANSDQPSQGQPGDVLTLNMDGVVMDRQVDAQPADELRLARLYGLAIVAPVADDLLEPSASCGNPHIGAVQAALRAAEATFNVTHLLFADALDYAKYLPALYANLQHIHGHHDLLRMLTDSPLSPSEGIVGYFTPLEAMRTELEALPHLQDMAAPSDQAEDRLQKRRRMLGAVENGTGSLSQVKPAGFLVATRGPFLEMMQTSETNALLSDVCMQMLPSQACVVHHD